jgi:hypothetical protein
MGDQPTRTVHEGEQEGVLLLSVTALVLNTGSKHNLHLPALITQLGFKVLTRGRGQKAAFLQEAI